jgi:hypothetical protein
MSPPTLSRRGLLRPGQRGPRSSAARTIETKPAAWAADLIAVSSATVTPALARTSRVGCGSPRACPRSHSGSWASSTSPSAVEIWPEACTLR